MFAFGGRGLKSLASAVLEAGGGEKAMTRLKVLWVAFDSGESLLGIRPQTDPVRDVGPLTN